MFTLRTLTMVGLVLVLASGASAQDKKGRSGNNHAKGNVQQRNQSKTATKLAVAPKPSVHSLNNKNPDLVGIAAKSGSRAIQFAIQTERRERRAAITPKLGSRRISADGQTGPEVYGENQSGSPARQTPKRDFGDRVYAAPKGKFGPPEPLSNLADYDEFVEMNAYEWWVW